MSPEAIRLKALRRFALSITILTIVGHGFLGFETADLQAVTSALTAYSVELLLETVAAYSQNRRPGYLQGGFNGLVTFLLPAHITGLAIGMLLYSQDQYLPYVLAATVAITSKAIFTVTVRGKQKHFLNPSNFGLVVAFGLFQTVSITGPYQFTENLHGIWTWSLPLFILVTGSMLNGKLTRKMPLVFSWLTAFVLQAVVRHLLFGTWLTASLDIMTGTGFVIFTLYMIPDPATSPSGTRGQIVFGATLALIYATLISLHIPFMLFYSLLILCIGRGIMMFAFEKGLFPSVLAFLNGTSAPPAMSLPLPAVPQMGREEVGDSIAT